MIYFDEPFLTITVETSYLKGQWRGFYSSANFRRGLEKHLEIVKETKITGCLVDISQSKVISLDDQNWLTTNWMPRVYESGLRKIGFVVPTDVLTQMALSRVGKLIPDKTIVVNYFDKETEAVNWLKSSD